MNKASVDLHKPTSNEEIAAIVSHGKNQGKRISICGKRHAMGGQQFCDREVLIDTSRLDSVVEFDSDNGRIRVQAGITWPKLHNYLRNNKSPWSFRQKQTGADELSLGGALAANIHGRGLCFKPFIDDVESFQLIDAEGIKECSREENRELFALVIGGYGLFGIVSEVSLRLRKRRPMVRSVEITDANNLISLFEKKITAGFEYGDFQFSCNDKGDDFLERGVFSCYKPLPQNSQEPAAALSLNPKQWKKLIYLAHVDKQKAFEEYAKYYLKTDGQTYWSDSMQMSTYIDDYHKDIDNETDACGKGSEMISELYVPRHSLKHFLKACRRVARRDQINIIYGTIRLIAQDKESYLPWAKNDYACVIFNLHVDHCSEGFAKARRDFRSLIDLALIYNGSFYLTYHRFASRAQVLKAYPQFIEFLREKREKDPEELFQSDWYRHYKEMFNDEL
jgi:FAD/FMN-containing dehydrogenase